MYKYECIPDGHYDVLHKSSKLIGFSCRTETEQLQNKQSTSEILNMATTLHCCHTGLVLWVRYYIHTDKHTYMLDLGQTIFTIILNLTLFILTYSCQ